MTASKTWSVTQTTTLLAEYKGVESNENLGKIGATLGKSVAMVRSKLVSEGVYEKAVTARKVGGASAVRKISIVGEIAKALGTSESLVSFEKATKADLETVLSILTAKAESE